MGAAPNATGVIHLIAKHGIGTTAGVNSRRLIWQVFGWINYFIFQRDLVPNQLTELDLFNMPGAIRHNHFLTTPLVYKMSDMATSDGRHIC
jgi:hypothetical protein